MKLAVLSFGLLVLLQFTNEILSYKIQSERKLLQSRGSILYDNEDQNAIFTNYEDEGDTQVLILINLLLNVAIQNKDLTSELRQLWIDAYEQGKLEPITSTLYKIVRTTIAKTDNEDVKKILENDYLISKMLKNIKSERDVAKLYEEISNNRELFFQALEVYNAYLKASELIDKDLDLKIKILMFDAFRDKSTLEFINSLVLRFELSSYTSEKNNDEADFTINDAKPPLVVFSNYLIDSIADGKLNTILQATYDASQLVIDFIDMSDPKVKNFLNEVLKFERILKKLIENEEFNQKRNYFIRQLLKLR